MPTPTESPATLECGHPPSPHESCTTGYGVDSDGKRYCYTCCAQRDLSDMIETGRATLYLVDGSDGQSPRVTNWPGSLFFTVGHVRKGRHNIARVQRTAYFRGPDGATWIARQYGENSDIARCRRLKA